MNYLQFRIDPREAAYGRLVANVLGTLRRAVGRRVSEGEKKADIAGGANLSSSHLSRILNGNVSNVTLRTVSDILWATRHDPVDFSADALEDLIGNGGPVAVASSSKPTKSSPVVTSTGATIVLTPKSVIQARTRESA